MHDLEFLFWSLQKKEKVMHDLEFLFVSLRKRKKECMI